MLFLLTGSIQSGKTRWLTRILRQLTDEGVTHYGVLAPGRWLEPDENGKREKVGIDNVLLPEGAVIDFATRRDLATADALDKENEGSQAAQLGWAIRDTAVTAVNDHFTQLIQLLDTGEIAPSALLVIDELGTLELKRNEGLTNALAFAEELPLGPLPPRPPLAAPPLGPPMDFAWIVPASHTMQ